MPPARIPFPFLLHIGTDIISTPRIITLMGPKRQQLVRFAERILHPLELQDLDKRFPWWRRQAELYMLPQEQKQQAELASSADLQRLSRWLGGRYAAKEAAKKAWGATKLGWKDVRVEVAGQGEVQIVCCPADVEGGRGNERGEDTGEGKEEVEGERAKHAELAKEAQGAEEEVEGKQPVEQIGRLSISHDGEYVIAMVLVTPLQISPSEMDKKED